MSPSRLVDVLAEVFQTYGFDTCIDSEPEGQSGATYRADLVAARNGVDVLIELHEADRALGETHVIAHQQMLSDIGATYGVILNTTGFDTRAHETAELAGTVLWDRDVLATMIGRAVLHEVQGPTEPPLIADILSLSARPIEPTTDDDVADMLPPMPMLAETPTAPVPASNAEPDPNAGFDPLGMMPPIDGPDETPANATPNATATPTDDAGPITGLAGLIHDALEPAPVPTYIGDATTQDDPRDDGTLHTIEASAAEPSPVTSPRSPVDKGNVTQGTGWVLETNRRIQPTPVEDPDPIPLPEPNPRNATPSHLASHLGLGRQRHQDDPRSFNPATGALLAPTIDRGQAAKVAKPKTFTIDHTWLRYHPKRVMRWNVEVFIEGQVDTTTLQGIALVDTATREVTLLDDWQGSRHLREGTFDVPVDHKPVRIDADRCRELALRPVLDNTSRTVTMEDHDSSFDVVVTQKKRIKAHPDDVRFTDEGLHWCPVWCFQGVNGSMEIDALDGRVLDEQLQSSANETIIL